jgi:CRISPR/Cas system CMR subunit Cmr6 (Cas7 group RAMP superfamily)
MMFEEAGTATITLTNEYGAYTVESYQSCEHISEVIDNLVVPVLLAAGWGKKSITDYIQTDVC